MGIVFAYAVMQKQCCYVHSLSEEETSFTFFFPLALQPQFGPWPTCMKLSVSLQFSRS
jgi:hypothetical protein